MPGGRPASPPASLGPGPSLLLVAITLTASSGCFFLSPSRGGGQTDFEPPRRIVLEDVALPPGYRLEVAATGLDLPTGVAFDETGRPHVTEAGYSYGELWTTPRLVRIEPDGTRTEVVAGAGPPWNGVAFHEGAFYVSAGGHDEGGRILRIEPGEEVSVTPVVTGLPSRGDHHTNGPLVGADGWLYFGQGTVTNSGVVGIDSYDFGWLARHPEVHDIPCADITLTGRNFTTGNPLASVDESAPREVTTGAFSPLGTATREGQRLPGSIPCSGAIFRVPPEGGEVELVAWGLRNPFGLAWAPDGGLYVTDNGYDRRGSRPVFGGADLLWRITRPEDRSAEGDRGERAGGGAGGAWQPVWHGWPDFSGGRPLTDRDWFRPSGGPSPGFLLAEHPNTPPMPAAVFGVHSSSNGFDFSRGDDFGSRGWAFVAQFGDMAPEVGKVLSPVGFKVVRVDPGTGVVRDFLVNRGGRNGPASRVGHGGLERPVAARFNPEGTALYVVDFGVMTVGSDGPEPRPGTGVLWRVTREEEPE